MPNETAPIVDPAKHNAEIAATQAAQDISGKSTVTGEFGDAGSALDKLASQFPDPATAPPEVKPTPPPAVDPKAPTPEEIAASEKAAQEAKRAEEIFKDAPKLPPNASPKSSEAFSEIKIRAARELSAREQKIAELEKKLAEGSKPTPEQLAKEKEVEDLRQWRAKLDVEYDPKFKEFDKSISQKHEFVYSQLLQNPAIKQDVIDQIKKLGGPDRVDLSKIFEAIKDPVLQRVVESTVADIQMTKFNKENAIKSARENLQQFQEERQKETAAQQIARVQEVQTELEGMLGKLDWIAERQAEANADDSAKKEAEEHNKFVGTLKAELSGILNDDSPKTRAILMTAAAQLFYLQRRVPGLEAKLAAAEKELGETKAKWERVKESGRSRLQESSAPPGGITPQKPVTDFNAKAGDALDALAKQVMEEHAAKAGR